MAQVKDCWRHLKKLGKHLRPIVYERCEDLGIPIEILTEEEYEGAIYGTAKELQLRHLPERVLSKQSREGT